MSRCVQHCQQHQRQSCSHNRRTSRQRCRVSYSVCRKSRRRSRATQECQALIKQDRELCNGQTETTDSKEKIVSQGTSRGAPQAGAKTCRYLAYFQAYTSTYAEVEYLRKMYEEALQVTDMVDLCVGTRPDCVPDAVLELLAGYQQQGFGDLAGVRLQSAHTDTLKRINRGHDYAAYADAVTRAKARNLKICTHLIVGLPGEAWRGMSFYAGASDRYRH